MSVEDLIICDRQKVRKALGKTDEEIKEYIGIIKKWVETQPHLPEVPEDNFIEFSLTNCKFSIENAKQNIDMYYTMRTLMPEFFKNMHPLKSASHKMAEKMGYYVVLPKLTDDLMRVSVLKLRTEGAAFFDYYKFFARNINTYEIRMMEDLNMGEIIIYDAKHLVMTHAVKFTPILAKKIALLLENVWKNRIKAIHVINHPSYIETIMSTVRIFMKTKIYDRIRLHPNLESLLKEVSQEILPADYGGKEKSLQELTDLWELKFKDYEKRFDDLETMTVKEELRPQPLLNSDILGYYGNFRKLNVD